MKNFLIRITLIITILVTYENAFCSIMTFTVNVDPIVSFTVNPIKDDLSFFWKNDTGVIIGNFNELRNYLVHKHKVLIFAMNGGMYTPEQTPVGLYIENGRIVHPLNNSNGYNYNYFKGQKGVFFITKNKHAYVTISTSLMPYKKITYASQSGPMLLIKGNIPRIFIKNSNNKNIRNAVGILPNGNILFAKTLKKINFYDFADYFRKMGCQNALYLDGIISKMYYPDRKQFDVGGKFGVIIAVTKNLEFK